MFSQLARYASQLDIEIEDAEMDIRMTYDTRGKLQLADISPGCRELSYVFKIQSPASSQKVQEMLQLIEKGCHTIKLTKKSGSGHGKADSQRPGNCSSVNVQFTASGCW